MNYNTIFAIYGEKKDILNFLSDGAGYQITDEIPDLTLRSWLPGDEDFKSNLNDLGVTQDATFHSWEWDNDNLLYVHIKTKGDFPNNWFSTIKIKYSNLVFNYITADEDLSSNISIFIEENIISQVTFDSDMEDEDKSTIEDILLKQFYRMNDSLYN